MKLTFNPWTIIAIFAVVFLVPGCQTTGSDSNNPAEIEVIKSTSERNTSPTLVEGDLDQLVFDNTVFTFNFYHEVKEELENLIFSTHSISVALAMTWAGARNSTETQMSQALQFNLPQLRLHPTFNALDLALNSRGEGGSGSSGSGFRLNIVNALWGQRDYYFLEDFLDVLAINYDAGMRILDFKADPEACRHTINDWVAQQTENRIENLLPEQSITGDTRLVLTNAIYFIAAWAIPFDEVLTEDGEFYLLDGDSVSVPMMTLSEGCGELGETTAGAVFDGYQAVELPYQGEELSMVLLVPDRGRFLEIEQRLDAEMIRSTVQALGNRTVYLVMPKFNYESTFRLKDTLSAMGMPEAFTFQADFSGMTGGKDLFIGNVYHKAFISVDEAGTEAAAASAVVMFEGGFTLPPMSVSIDRPFIYFIRDIETGAILFLGRVLNPQI